MAKYSFLFRCMIISTYLMILFLLQTIPYLISHRQTTYITLDQTVHMRMNDSNRCVYHQNSYLNAPKSEFDIKVHEKLQNCLQPEDDSRQLSANLDFMKRSK